MTTAQAFVETTPQPIDIEAVDARVQQIFGRGLGRVSVDGGEVNDVLLAPEAGLAIRFPRYTEATAHNDRRLARICIGMTLLGLSTLATLAEVPAPPVPIPRVRDIWYDDPELSATAVVLSYLPGARVTTQQIREEFTSSEKASFGRTVAECAAWLAAALPKNAANWLGKNVDGRPPSHLRAIDHLGYLSYVFEKAPAEYIDRQRYPNLVKQLRSLGKEYHAYRKAGKLQSTIFGHHDLFAENFLFAQNEHGEQTVCGWLDFEACRESTPERELRHLWRTGPEVAGAGIERYQELTGKDIDPALSFFYARAQYLSVALFGLRHFGAVTRPALRALPVLYPGTDWAELRQDSVQ
jgi:hypothetical protein